MKPEITVLMSVFNGSNTVANAIESILNQTFKNFEFIIINDGSTDDTSEILNQFSKADSRINLFEQKNLGLTKSLNNGVNAANGKYIARQDADDLSKPQRLQKQLLLFQNNPSIALVGSNSEDHYDSLGASSEWGFYSDEELKSIVYLQTPFPHSSAMVRTDALRAVGGYNEDFKTSQDADLWMRIASKHEISMCPEALIERHIHPNSISSKKHFRQCIDSFNARRRSGKVNLLRCICILIRQLAVGSTPQAVALTLKRLKKKFIGRHFEP